MAKKQRFKPTFLRAWRDHCGLTQEAAAPDLGMTRENLSKIERGLVPYDQELLERAAKLYKCRPTDILARDPADRSFDIFDTIQSLGPIEREHVSEIIATFKRKPAA